MALDDFATASEMGVEPGAVDLDEDLFDFPLQQSMESLVAEEGGGRTASSAAPPPVEHHDVHEPPPATAAATTFTGLDPELDEDLFGFPPMESPGQARPAPRVAPTPAEAAAAQVADFLEDDLDALIGEAEVEERAKAAPAAQPRAAAPPVAPVSTAPPAAPAQGVPLFVPPGGQLAPVAVGSSDPRIAWALTAAALVFVLGILGIAWRAVSGMGSAWERMQGTVEEGNRRMTAQLELTMRRQLEMEAELLHQKKLAAEAAASLPEAQKPRELMAPHELSLLVAEEAIGAGEFEEARRVLYNLLATADRLDEEDRAEAEERAAFLVGRTYQAEAEHLAGGER